MKQAIKMLCSGGLAAITVVASTLAVAEDKHGLDSDAIGSAA